MRIVAVDKPERDDRGRIEVEYVGLPEIMKTSFCGRFPERWDDVKTDAKTRVIASRPC